MGSVTVKSMSRPPVDHRKILVIDDTPTMRLIVTGMLEDLGFQTVLQAESSDVAMKLIQTEAFDLVLCDWNMPGRTGIEFIRNLRAQPATASLPVLMMTSNNDPRQIAEARTAGVSSYLVKPFGPADLRDRLEEAFRAHSDVPIR